MPRSAPATAIRICRCWCGGKKSMIRLIVLGRVERVQRREDEVAGLGRRQRGRDGLRVAHLADEDDIGVLAQHASERRPEVGGVGTDLTLVDDRLLVGVQDLDRVLDGHDVAAHRRVDVVDHRGEGRRLP